MDKTCQSCNKPFDAISQAALFCSPCGDKRREKQAKLWQQKAKDKQKVERKVGRLLPIDPVNGWQQLILEDLANPFNDFTEQELCVKYGVPAQVFYEWKLQNLSSFQNEVGQRSEKYRDQLSTFYHKMLVKRAKSGSDTAIQIGLEMTRQYSRKTPENDPAQGLSDDDKKRRISELLSKLENK